MPMFLAPSTRLAPLLAASMKPGPPPVQTTKCWSRPVLLLLLLFRNRGATREIFQREEAGGEGEQGSINNIFDTHFDTE